MSFCSGLLVFCHNLTLCAPNGACTSAVRYLLDRKVIHIVVIRSVLTTFSTNQILSSTNHPTTASSKYYAIVTSRSFLQAGCRFATASQKNSYSFTNYKIGLICFRSLSIGTTKGFSLYQLTDELESVHRNGNWCNFNRKENVR